MIYIIHGDDNSASYRRLQDLTTKMQKLTHFDCEKGQLKDLELLLDSQELFAEKKTVVIENPKKISTKQADEFTRLVNQFEQNKLGDIIIYSETSLDEKFVSKLNKPMIFVHQLPKLFFQFLDSLSPSTYKKALLILSQMRNNTEDEQIFYALIKRVRLLIMFKLSDKQEFSELSKMAPWQKGKIQKQADCWTLNGLLDFYKKLFETEIDLKSSGIANSLSDRLDNLIASAVN